MKLFNLKNIKYLLGLGLFVSVYIGTHRNWFLSLNPISFGDIGFLYKDFYTDLFNTLSPTWNGGINFGANSQTTLTYFGFNFWGAVLAKFGFDYNFILRGIMFYPLLIGFVISVLVMSRLFKNNITAAVIFGLVFAINTLVIVVWLNLLVAYAFLPLIFFALYKYLNRNKIVWLLVFSLLFTGILFYEIRVGFIAFLIAVILTVSYWAYKPISREIFLRQFVQLIFSLGVVFLLIAFFTFPLFHAESLSVASGITSQALFGTQFYNLQYPMVLMQPFWNEETFQVFYQQPIKFYFWVYPIFAFSALFFAKKDKKIIYFSFLAIFGIFMGKGANIPFGGIYAWLYYNLPFFNFFREPVQWWVIIGFSYATLIGYFLYYFYQEIEKLKKKRFPKVAFVSSFIKVLITLPVIYVTLTIASPAYDGRLGHGLNSVSFAKEYDLFRQFLLGEKNFYRTLNIPSNQRFTYYSNNHPYVAFNYLPDSLKSLNTKLLSLESIRYVVLSDDVLGDVYVNRFNKDQYESFIESTDSNREYKNLKRVKGFGNIKLWENPNDIPHLMAVEDSVYITGPQILSELIDIPTSKQVAYYSEQNIPLEAPQKVKDVIANTNNTMYETATKIFAVASCVRCDLNKKYTDYVRFPYARILPDNLLYPLIEIKEKKSLNVLATVEDKFKMEAFFGEKRAVEIQAMKKNHLTNKKYIISAFAKANQLIDDMEEKYKKFNNQKINNTFLTAADYLYTQIRTYDDLYQEENDKEIQNLLSKITYRLNALAAKLSQNLWVTENDKKKLIVNLPEGGNYGVFVKNDDEISLNDTQLIINDKRFQKSSVSGDGFISYGNYKFSKGEYFLELDIPSVNLLELPSLSNDLVKADKIKIVSLKDPRSQYRLSFDYKVIGGRAARFFISDDAYPFNPNVSNNNLILDRVLKNYNDEEWYHFNIFFNPYHGIKNPVLHLKGDEGSEVEYKNLSLSKVISPTIVFVKDTGKVLDTPKITYQEITSTDYIIKIENAKKPFLLSFSEQFDNNWTILSTKEQSFYGNNLTTTKYFGKNVEEVAYANRIEPAVLAGSLIDDRKMDALHMGLNGFSNGWFINKVGTYQVHLTFSSQKHFLIGLIVSVSTLIAIILTIGFLLFKKEKK